MHKILYVFIHYLYLFQSFMHTKIDACKVQVWFFFLRFYWCSSSLYYLCLSATECVWLWTAGLSSWVSGSANESVDVTSGPSVYSVTASVVGQARWLLHRHYTGSFERFYPCNFSERVQICLQYLKKKMSSVSTFGTSDRYEVLYRHCEQVT